MWKKIPEWLVAPAAVFESDTVDGRLVLVAPEPIAGASALLIVEPKDNGVEAHVVVNSYNAQGGMPPFARLAGEEKTRHIDRKKFPAVLTASRLQLLSTAFQNKPGTVESLTEKNLRGHSRPGGC